jgi:hypothetical protein
MVVKKLSLDYDTEDREEKVQQKYSRTGNTRQHSHSAFLKSHFVDQSR